MTSAVDSTKPATGSPTTASVRSNFAALETEVNELHRMTEDTVSAAGTDTYTADFTNDVTLADGVRILCDFTNANTLTGASVTLNVDGTGAVQIVDKNGDDLAAGDIEAGAYLDLVYDATGTEWIALNIDTQTQTNTTDIAALGDQFTVTTGTFTPTWTGFSADPTLVIRWTKYEPSVAGDAIVILALDSGVATGTSNATTMSFTGMPAAILPTGVVSSSDVSLKDSAVSGGGGSPGSVSINPADLTTFYLSTVSGSVINLSASAFTASGTKGLSSFTIVYSIPS